jgi:hypothetical protein
VKPRRFNSVTKPYDGQSAMNVLLTWKLNVVAKRGSSSKMKRFVADRRSH